MPAKFDPHHAARIVVDATQLGVDASAKLWGCSRKSIARYRAKLNTDPEFAAIVDKLMAEANREWRGVRIRFLRRAITKLTELVDAAKSSRDISAVASAVKTVGELQVATDALNLDDPAGDQGPEPPQAAGGDAGGGTNGSAARTVH